MTAATSERPAAATPRPYRFPEFERLRTSAGLNVVVAPVRKLPLVTLLMVMDAGAMAEPPDHEGVATLTARALLEGTLRRTGNELTERFERLGAAVIAAADWDVATLSMTVLRSHLDEAVPLFGEVVREPAFPEREVRRLRAERLAELLQLRAEPRGLADEMFAAFLYAAASRYAWPEDGSSASVGRLERSDLERLHRARYRPGRSTLIVVGDIEPDVALAQAERLAAGWEGTAEASVVPSGEAARAGRAVHVVSKPDAPQSELRMGHVGLARSHPDYFPVLVMNSLLGGLFSSRINLNLREAHGYTYGAFSGFAWRRGPGPFVVSTAVRSDVTADAVREIVHEIDRMRAEPVGDDELSLATSYLAGVFPIKYETTDAIARALAALVAYDLPLDYFDRYRERVRAVTTEDVHRVAVAHLHPEQLQVVVVGDAAAVRGPLGALGLGPVTQQEADEEP